MRVYTRNLIKAAAGKKGKDEVSSYEDNPSKKNKKNLIARLEAADRKNPLHVNGGYYKNTKDLLDRSEEMIDRGNVVRGTLGKYVGVPVTAVTDTLTSPFKGLVRLVSPRTNIDYSSIEDIKEDDDPKHIARAARELFNIYKEERPDPVETWEHTNSLVKKLKTAPEGYVGDVAAHAASGGIPLPGVGEVVTDVVSVPHTLLFNKLKWNGTSRDSYKKKKEKEKK